MPIPQSIAVVVHEDDRGKLISFEHVRPLPFTPVRFFVIYGVPQGAARAAHNVTCQQVLVAATGACTLCWEVDGQRGQDRLESPSTGIVVPKGCFIRLEDFQPGTVLVVACDDVYEPRRQA